MTVHVHQDGLLELRFRAVGRGRTMIAGRRQRFPLRTTAATYPDDGDPGMPWVILQNPTGGIFPGDRLDVRIDLEAGARAHVRNQSATKIYAGDGDAARQNVAVALADGAVGEFLGDVLIPHAGSSLVQSLALDVAPTARMIYAETLAAGRVAHGERFAFTRVRLETRVSVAGVLASWEVLDLDPHRRHPARRGLFGSATHLTTILAVCPDADVEALAAATDADLARSHGVGAAATPLPAGAGILVRALSCSAREARGVVADTWTSLRPRLVGSLPPRRLI